jgi:hypothetical protein
VIIDANNLWQLIQVFKQGTEKLLSPHADTQSTLVQRDLMQGLHGQMQDDFPVLTPCLTQQTLAMRCVRQDGVSDIARQLQGGHALGLVVANIVDDDGYADCGLGLGDQWSGEQQQTQ